MTPTSIKSVIAIFLLILIVLGITESNTRQLLTFSVLIIFLLATFSIKKGSMECLTIVLAYISISASHYVLRLPISWGSEDVLALKPAFLLLMFTMLLSHAKKTSVIILSEWIRVFIFTTGLLIAVSIVGYVSLRSSYSLEPLVFKGIIQNLLFIFASYISASGLLNKASSPFPSEATA